MRRDTSAPGGIIIANLIDASPTSFAVNYTLNEVGDKHAQAMVAVADKQFAEPARERTKRVQLRTIQHYGALAVLVIFGGIAAVKLDGSHLALVLVGLGGTIALERVIKAAKAKGNDEDG